MGCFEVNPSAKGPGEGGTAGTPERMRTLIDGEGLNRKPSGSSGGRWEKTAFVARKEKKEMAALNQTTCEIHLGRKEQKDVANELRSIFVPWYKGPRQIKGSLEAARKKWEGTGFWTLPYQNRRKGKKRKKLVK